MRVWRREEAFDLPSCVVALGTFDGVHIGHQALIRRAMELARALESGEMTLEDSFAAFERANALRRELQRLLDEGDERIRVLTEAGEDELNAEDIK